MVEHLFCATHVDDAPGVLPAADLLAGLGLDDGVGADDGEGDALLQPRVLPPLVLLALALLAVRELVDLWRGHGVRSTFRVELNSD